MISGVRASSIRIESTSSTMPKLNSALDVIVQLEFHVVAQVIEAELVVGAVSDIGVVGCAALTVVEIMHDGADRQPEERDECRPIHSAVAAGQVIVHGDDVHALAFERVQITGSVATSVFPSPVFISAIRPRCSTMPPISCTSKCRMFK